MKNSNFNKSIQLNDFYNIIDYVTPTTIQTATRRSTAVFIRQGTPLFWSTGSFTICPSLRCDLIRQIPGLVAGEAGLIVLCRVRRGYRVVGGLAALHQNHRHVPQPRRWVPQFPQSPDSGAPGHSPDTIPPGRGATGAGSVSGQAEAALRPSPPLARLPGSVFHLPAAWRRWVAPLAHRGCSFPLGQSSHTEI